MFLKKSGRKSIEMYLKFFKNVSTCRVLPEVYYSIKKFSALKVTPEYKPQKQKKKSMVKKNKTYISHTFGTHLFTKNGTKNLDILS